MKKALVNLIRKIGVCFIGPDPDPDPLLPNGNGQLSSGVDKPTTVLANMIAADILQGKFRLARDRLSSEKFEISISAYFEPFKKATDRTLADMVSDVGKKDAPSSRRLAVVLIKPCIDLSEDKVAQDVLALAILKRAVHVREEAKLKAKFDNQQKAVDAIENWMGIKPEPEPKPDDTCRHGGKKCLDMDCDRDCHCK